MGRGYEVEREPEGTLPGRLRKTGKSVYLVSAEPSGDQLSVGLIRELRDRAPDLHVHAIGGDAVRREGFTSAIPTEPLAVLGFVEGLKALPVVNDLAMRAVQDIVAKRPDAVVLIDSWGFSIRVAKLLKLNGLSTHIVKYVAPQVWAMRRGRAKVLARFVDNLLCLYPFDAPFFTRHGLPTTVVGHPVLDTDHSAGDGPGFRKRHRISRLDPLLLVAFGSRAAEVDRLTEAFVETIRILKAKRPGLAIVSPIVPATAARLTAKLATMGLNGIEIIGVDEDEKLDAFAASDFAIAKSGTITTQLADAGVPTVVAYKVNGLTYHAAKWLMKADYITIANVVADTALMPEFIQHEVVPERMAEVLDGWLDDPRQAASLSEALRAVASRMRGGHENGGANARAAAAVLDVLSG